MIIEKKNLHFIVTVNEKYVVDSCHFKIIIKTSVTVRKTMYPTVRIILIINKLCLCVIIFDQKFL